MPSAARTAAARAFIEEAASIDPSRTWRVSEARRRVDLVLRSLRDPAELIDVARDLAHADLSTAHPNHAPVALMFLHAPDSPPGDNTPTAAAPPCATPARRCATPLVIAGTVGAPAGGGGVDRALRHPLQGSQRAGVHRGRTNGLSRRAGRVAADPAGPTRASG